MVVVGGGIAGMACARVVRDAGHRVVVRDRGRRPGGRLASRTLAGRATDLGASYLTARDPAFRAVVDGWVARGLARPWTDAFDRHGDDGWSRTGDGPLRYGAAHGLRSLVEDLAADLDVRSGDPVTTVGAGPTVDGEPVDAVALALPDPQAARLLAPDLDEERAAVDVPPWTPVLAVAAGWPARRWRDLNGVFVSDDPVLAWVADDGRRRGDDAPVLVAHTTGDFAAEHLSDPETAVPDVVAALRSLLDVGEPPAWTYVQRWSFARPGTPHDAPFHLGPARVGLCGDGWGSPRVETAWLSGTALGGALVDALA